MLKLYILYFERMVESQYVSTLYGFKYLLVCWRLTLFVLFMFSVCSLDISVSITAKSLKGKSWDSCHPLFYEVTWSVINLALTQRTFDVLLMMVSSL